MDFLLSKRILELQRAQKSNVSQRPVFKESDLEIHSRERNFVLRNQKLQSRGRSNVCKQTFRNRR